MFNLIFGLGGQEILVILIVFSVLIYFITKIIQSKVMSTEQKIIWILVLLFFNYIGLIIFLLTGGKRKL